MASWCISLTFHRLMRNDWGVSRPFFLSFSILIFLFLGVPFFFIFLFVFSSPHNLPKLQLMIYASLSWWVSYSLEGGSSFISGAKRRVSVCVSYTWNIQLANSLWPLSFHKRTKEHDSDSLCLHPPLMLIWCTYLLHWTLFLGTLVLLKVTPPESSSRLNSIVSCQSINTQVKEIAKFKGNS